MEGVFASKGFGYSEDKYVVVLDVLVSDESKDKSKKMKVGLICWGFDDIERAADSYLDSLDISWWGYSIERVKHCKKELPENVVAHDATYEKPIDVVNGRYVFSSPTFYGKGLTETILEEEQEHDKKANFSDSYQKYNGYFKQPSLSKKLKDER